MKTFTVLLSFVVVLSLSSFAQTQLLSCDGYQVSRLSVKTFSNGDPIKQAQSYEEWYAAANSKTAAWCYYDDDDKQGILYNWYAVNDKRGLSPQGLVLLNNKDFENLDKCNQKDKLIINGSRYERGNYNYGTGTGAYWSLDSLKSDVKRSYKFTSNNLSQLTIIEKGSGCYVLCKIKQTNDATNVITKNETNNTQVSTQETKNDITLSKDPNSSLVKIGNNYWQNQNCRITKYINGDPIFYAKNVQELSAANKRKEGAYCFINFNSKLDSSYIVYNWYAIMDPRGFGTKELRVPNWADWKNLISTLEKDGKTHNDLKKVEDWDKNTNYPASNFYGFNGTPTFYGYPDGYYVQENFRKTNGMYFWIPNDNVGSYFKLEDGKAYQAGFTNDGSKIYYTQEFKNSMFPMRLVKGETSYFDGNVVSGQKQGQGTLYVRNDDIYRYDYVNYINVEIGSKIEGNWVDNQLEGRAKITWYDGASEDALFSKNHHEGALKVIQNTTQKCLYDGKIFNSHYKKTSAEIEDEKSTTQNITIRAYKTEYYCSTICEKKAQEEMLKRQQEAREREIQRSREQANNSGPKWQCGSCMMLSFQNYEPSRQGCINSGQHFWWEVDSSHPLWECNTCHKVSYKDSEPPNYLKDCSGYDGRHYWVKVNRN
jgi:uncharacterized protein (TIGR02145 family)